MTRYLLDLFVTALSFVMFFGGLLGLFGHPYDLPLACVGYLLARFVPMRLGRGPKA